MWNPADDAAAGGTGSGEAGAGGGAAAPVAPAGTPAPDPVGELRTIIESQNAQIRALSDTVQGALSARPVVSSGGDGSGISPQLRQALRQKGLSDADINHNAPLVLPFVEIFAPELVGLVEGRVGPVAEAVTLGEMAQDAEAYPYAKALRPEIKKLLADAKKEGRPLSPEAAYHTAVSMDVSGGEKSKVRQVDTQRRAESAGGDASATSGVGHRGSSNQGARAGARSGPRTAADLKSLSFDDRMKFYNDNGDAPIQ